MTRSYRQKSSYSKEDLIDHGQKEMFGSGNARLPVDNMLVIDRIKHISNQGGKYGKGEIIAEFDIHPDLWFFKCHFIADPVMPGCLGLDALWQLLGFFLAWDGGQGRGRALGCGDLKFSGQVLPTTHKVTYHLDIRKVIRRSLVLGIADGSLSIDNGQKIYEAKNLRVGLFQSADDYTNNT